MVHVAQVRLLGDLAFTLLQVIALCAMPSQLPGQPCALCMMKMGCFLTLGWDDGAWVKVCGCSCCWWCHLLTGSDDVAMSLFLCCGHQFLLRCSCWPFRIEKSPLLRTYYFIEVNGRRQGLGVEGDCSRGKGGTGVDRREQRRGAR